MRGSERDRQFVEYVDARRAALVRTTYLVTGDWHEAEDVVQAALIKLYAAWPRVRRDGREDAYVRRIVMNTYLDRLRRRSRRGEVLTDELFDRAVWEPDDAARERDDRVRAALRQLPPGRRAVVVLRYYEGLSVEETAEELDLSVGTVKSQCSRALATLRAAIGNDERSRA